MIENEQIPSDSFIRDVNLPWFGGGGFDSQPYENQFTRVKHWTQRKIVLTVQSCRAANRALEEKDRSGPAASPAASTAGRARKYLESTRESTSENGYKDGTCLYFGSCPIF